MLVTACKITREGHYGDDILPSSEWGLPSLCRRHCSQSCRPWHCVCYGNGFSTLQVWFLPSERVSFLSLGSCSCSDLFVLFRTRGGIMFWADSFGSKYIYSRLEEWSKTYGEFFEPCAFLAERSAKGAPLVRHLNFWVCFSSDLKNEYMSYSISFYHHFCPWHRIPKHYIKYPFYDTKFCSQ